MSSRFKHTTNSDAQNITQEQGRKRHTASSSSISISNTGGYHSIITTTSSSAHDLPPFPSPPHASDRVVDESNDHDAMSGKSSLQPAFEFRLEECIDLASPTPSAGGNDEDEGFVDDGSDGEYYEDGEEYEARDEEERYDSMDSRSGSPAGRRVSPARSPSRNIAPSSPLMAGGTRTPTTPTTTSKRPRVYRQPGTDRRVPSRTSHRDRTPGTPPSGRGASPVPRSPTGWAPSFDLGHGGLLTPELSPTRGMSLSGKGPKKGKRSVGDKGPTNTLNSSSSSASEEDLPGSKLHGNNAKKPHGAGAKLLAFVRTVLGMGVDGATNALAAVQHRRRSSVHKLGNRTGGKPLTGAKYVDKDDMAGGRQYKPKSSKMRRNALIATGLVLVLGYFYLFGTPLSSSRSPATTTTSSTHARTRPPSTAAVNKVRSKLRGKAQKQQISSTVPTDADSHLLDGLPKDVLTFPRHPIDRLDGTLIVNGSLPAVAHPIYQLIKDGREKWDRKVKRQSKTLKQAVVEYRRRNGGMNPPKGFDKWWRFCVEHDIPLPDEYDQINSDLRIFRALSPRELAARVERASQLEDTFTLSVTAGSIRTHAGYSAEIGGADDRVSGQVNLLETFGIQHWLPDFKAVYGIHDTPQGVIEWSHRRDLLERVEDDEYYQGDEELDFMKRGLVHACPPTSRTGASGEVYQDPFTKEHKTFIENPSQTFDLCQHPSYFPIHGITLDKLPHMDRELKAVFSLSKTSLNTDILGVPVEQFMDNLHYIPWDERKEDRLLWRGSNTGSYSSVDFHWRQTQRLRLVGETSPKERGTIELLPVPGSVTKGTIDQSTFKVNKGTVNAITMDITFAGLPIQCNVEDGTCDDLSREYNFNLQHMTHEEALQYKYILDVDGNSWSARTRRLFAGGSLLFKSTIMPEWWTERAQAWVHYVPINLDYSDMHDALMFFRGDIYGRGGEDALAKEIARAGVEWADSSWRKVDMAAYVARLYLEWARLLAPSRSGSDFVYHPSMEVTKGDLASA